MASLPSTLKCLQCFAELLFLGALTKIKKSIFCRIKACLSRLVSGKLFIEAVKQFIAEFLFRSVVEVTIPIPRSCLAFPVWLVVASLLSSVCNVLQRFYSAGSVEKNQKSIFRQIKAWLRVITSLSNPLNN